MAVTSRSDPVTSRVFDLFGDPCLFRWSNRILIVSLLCIAALTLFPFRFDFSLGLPGNTSPLLLGPFHKRIDFLDSFLNVLLFVPFGFALSNQFRLRNRSKAATFALVFAAGAICSYLVELLQVYVPGRDSGWEDVLTNSAGAVAGFFVFAGWGRSVLRHLSNCEAVAEEWLLPHRIALILVSYLGLCFAASVPLQHSTRLTNWDPNCFFLIGGDGSGQHLWKGKIFNLQIWDKALPDRLARRLTAGDSPAGNDPHSLISYDFSTSSPFQDEQKFLPALLPLPDAPALGSSRSLDLNGNLWLTSKEPVSNLARKLQKTSQFAIRIVCEPAQVAGANGHILSLGDESHVLNLRLRQEGDDLVIWLRNPLSMGRGNLVWTVPRVFVLNQVRTILVSYDGSYGSIYVDGNRFFRPYRLSPGASLAQLFAGIGTRDLDGYIVVYDSLIFVPGGLLLGVVARTAGRWGTTGWLLLLAGFVVPPVLFELLLVWVSARTISLGQMGLCAALCLAGCVLMNADHPRVRLQRL